MKKIETKSAAPAPEKTKKTPAPKAKPAPALKPFETRTIQAEVFNDAASAAARKKDLTDAGVDVFYRGYAPWFNTTKTPRADKKPLVLYFA